VGFIAAVAFSIQLQPQLAHVSMLLGAASLGFLVWNWYPARIFMGDVGSGFLGFMFGALAVASVGERPVSLVWFLVLGSVFVFDATVTMIRRAVHGEAIHSAHRRHAYQRIAQTGLSHAVVSGVVGALNILLGLLVIVSMRRAGSMKVVLLTTVWILGLLYVMIERRSPMYSSDARKT
jgi:Fuc2NAc and GlcNAc transferase